MPVDDRELRLVCTAMLLSVAVSVSLALGLSVLCMLLAAALLLAVARLWACARRPDPWRTFERALVELGVVVAEAPDPDVPVHRLPRPHLRLGGHRQPCQQPTTHRNPW